MIKRGKRGVYVVIEGVDVAGKSTIATEVVKRLEENKRKHFGVLSVNIHHRREPSYTNNGLKMRNILSTKKDLTDSDEVELAQLMLLDRIENTTNICGLLRDNDIVIQERNFLTALAYNEAIHTDEVNFVQEINKVSLRPDLLLLVDISPETIEHRLANREQVDAYETIELINKRRQSYLSNNEYIDVTMQNNTEEDKEKIINYLITYIERAMFN